MTQRSKSWSGATLALAGLLAGCASSGPSTYNPPPRSDDGTRTVSCQLPPQIRRLGQNATYLAAGRIVQTTAADCRVRGGQYREQASAPAPAAPAATGAPMPVIVGGDRATAACPVVGTISGLRQGSTLNVRSGPGTTHSRLDSLTNGRRIYVCDGSADEAWLGVVYPTTEGQDCGVTASRGDAGAYAGPCRAGWVNAGWVKRDN